MFPSIEVHVLGDALVSNPKMWEMLHFITRNQLEVHKLQIEKPLQIQHNYRWQFIIEIMKQFWNIGNKMIDITNTARL